MNRWLAIGVAVAGISAAGIWSQAQSSDVAADYERANTLRERVRNKIFDVAETPNWIAGGQRFWYRKSVKGGNRFVLVDPGTSSKAPAFDHSRLANGIKTLIGGNATEVSLPFTTFTYVENMSAIEFGVGGGGGANGGGAGGGGRGAAPVAQSGNVHCSLTEYVCSRTAGGNGGNAPQASRGQNQGQGQGRGGVAQGSGGGQLRLSPDGRFEAFVRTYNVFVRPAGRASEETALSREGMEGSAYTFQSLQWSPDSKKLVAFRRVPGFNRQVTYVQSSPANQVQPRTTTQVYRKPGDDVDIDMPVLFNVEAKAQIVVDKTLFPNPYSNQRLAWRQDSRSFTFEYNQRGHQVYRLIEVDGTTGVARALIDESTKTFVDYRRTATGLTDSGRTERFDLSDGKEIIWMSERDGWSHLYLFDGLSAQVKNQITKGNWAVHHVERVDEVNRQIYFTANGMDAGKDPYWLHWFRINFDGTGLTRFTEGDGTHTVTWSPDRAFYVDSYSRVDLPTVVELRRTSDQKLVLELERADVTDLLATGWRLPEVFTAKGRDGQTDIWGVIVRPTNFDATKKYPVIENIYAGPQGSFVPKTFGTQAGMQTLAELGFIVVQIDGMGTANRSKAFHNVAFKNLQDAGFPDRILWHKAAATKYGYYDATRVGVYGTSAGGQSAAGAVLFHPEFYKAGAASAGCHDNRMDKMWWNEQWMGYPVGPEYEAASNVTHAKNLEGALLLIVGEIDMNVDPASTMQVVNALIQANKNFELLVIPNADHTDGGAYGDHRRFDFFMRHLRGVEGPSWNTRPSRPSGIAANFTPSVLDESAMPWVASENWDAPEGE